MHRFFADAREGCIALRESDAQHARRVLRLSAGDTVEVVCGGERWRAELQTEQEGLTPVRLLDRLPDTEPQAQVTLYQGLPKGDKLEWIIQKGTELGLAVIRPVAMERSVVRLDARAAEKKRVRWQAIAEEAVKQCGRVAAPQVESVCTLSALTEEWRALDLLLVPWEAEADKPSCSAMEAVASLKEREAPRIGIVIGPEGGITEEEIALLRGCGAQTVTLGPRILRTETAALAAATLVLGALGALG